jgi:hypothetical protein
MKNIIRIFGITLILLLIPLVFQLTVGTGVEGEGFNWRIGDFVMMGILIFVIGLLIDIAWCKMGKYRLWGVIVSILLFWLWAELAVGIFTTWGS